ncbi:MAG: sulfotransferase [Candidatus Promineifilaceae bacterium]|nr:sulfotransferase [Candidatus Promineifilaceae bacterium]
MIELRERPFFIVGQPRSGTTLLRAIVNAHPRLFVPPETGFLPFLQVDGRLPPGDKHLTPEETTSLLEQIGRLNREWHGVVGDAPAFYNELSAGGERPSVTQLLDALYRRMMGDRGERWGDKTPGYVRYIPHVDRLFPRALVVHVVRDGRDTVLSAREKWQERRHQDTYYLLQRWVDSVTAGRRDGRRLGAERYREIHYEDLVKRPAVSVRQLCDFLGETFHPAMLDHSQQFREKDAGSAHPEVHNPIFSASAGRWHQEMTPFDRKLAHHLAGPTLRTFGYETPDPGPWAAGERLRRFLLALRYRLLANLRRLLYAAGILTLNRGKRNRPSRTVRKTT